MTNNQHNNLPLLFPSPPTYSCPNPMVSSTAQVSFSLNASYVLYGGKSSLLKHV